MGFKSNWGTGGNYITAQMYNEVKPFLLKDREYFI